MGRSACEAKRDASRLTGLVIALTIALLALPGMASADVNSPTVTLNTYSPIVSGNIGEDVAGVTVTAKLMRADGSTANPFTGAPPTSREVAIGTATTAADGNWTLRLAPVDPSGGPADGFDATGDTVSLSYEPPAGLPATAVPVAASYTADASNSSLRDGAYISADGSTLTFADFCGTGNFIVDGTDYPVTGTSSRGYCSSPVVHATPALTDADNVQFESSLPQYTGVNVLTQVGLPGILPPLSGPPTCSADLVSDLVTCVNLNAGSFAVKVNNGAAVALTIAPGPYSSYTGMATIPGLVPGDVLTLDETSPVVTTRHLSTLHLFKLTVSENSAGAVLSGTCQPNKDFLFTAADSYEFAGTDGPLCPASGKVTSLESGVIPALLDDQSGGTTTVSVPSLSTVIPTPEDSVPANAFTAYAFPASASGATGSALLAEIRTVSLKIVPHGGSTPVFVGTAKPHDDSQGPYETVNVSGLQPGLYNADWVLTDDNGDTISYSNLFAAQPGGQLPVNVSCHLGSDGHARLPQVNCAITVGSESGTAVMATLMRDRRTVATEHGTTRHGVVRLSLLSRRGLARGSYTVEVTASHGRSLGIRSVKLELK